MNSDLNVMMVAIGYTVVQGVLIVYNPGLGVLAATVLLPLSLKLADDKSRLRRS